MEKKDHIISILVHNKPDVLARIAGTLGGKGYNIDSLCVNTTTQNDISKIVMTTSGSQATITRIVNELQKLVDVISADDLTNVESIHREMVLVRLNLTADNQESVKKAIDTNALEIEEFTENSEKLTKTIFDKNNIIDSLLNLLKQKDIK